MREQIYQDLQPANVEGFQGPPLMAMPDLQVLKNNSTKPADRAAET